MLFTNARSAEVRQEQLIVNGDRHPGAVGVGSPELGLVEKVEIQKISSESRQCSPH